MMKSSHQVHGLQQILKKIEVLRFLGFLIGLLLSIKLLASCTAQPVIQPDNQPSAYPVTLKLLVTEDEFRHWKPLIEQFEAKTRNKIRIYLANQDLPEIGQEFSWRRVIHPLLKIINWNSPKEKEDQLPEKVAERIKELYVDAFKSESEDDDYDLVYMDVVWLPQFAEKKWLVPLSDVFPKDFSREKLEEEFLLNEVKYGVHDDKVYRVPFRTDIGMLYYRKDLLDEELREKVPPGTSLPPKTFTDLINISSQLQRDRKVPYGFLWQYKRYRELENYEGLVAVFVEVLHGYGGFWINEKRDIGLNRPEAVKAVNFLLKTIKDGISPTDSGNKDDQERETRRQFREGKAAFMRNWPNAWRDANGEDSKIRGQVGIIPMVAASSQTSSGACQGGWGFGIAQTIDKAHAHAAKEAIEFFTSAAVQRQFTLSYGSVPSRRKLFFDPQIVARYNHYPELLKWMGGNREGVNWIARPPIPKYAEASCILQRHLFAALNPDKNGYPNAEQAMRDAAKETEKLLKDGESSCKIPGDG